MVLLLLALSRRPGQLLVVVVIEPGHRGRVGRGDARGRRDAVEARIVVVEAVVGPVEVATVEGGTPLARAKQEVDPRGALKGEEHCTNWSTRVKESKLGKGGVATCNQRVVLVGVRFILFFLLSGDISR
jgi:hypothetical protein